MRLSRLAALAAAALLSIGAAKPAPRQAGPKQPEQRGNWLVARAYIAAGLVEPALVYARRTMEITAAHHQELADFDRASQEIGPLLAKAADRFRLNFL